MNKNIFILCLSIRHPQEEKKKEERELVLELFMGNYILKLNSGSSLYVCGIVIFLSYKNGQT